jgi:hypothetical protein
MSAAKSIPNAPRPHRATAPTAPSPAPAALRPPAATPAPAAAAELLRSSPFPGPAEDAADDAAAHARAAERARRILEQHGAPRDPVYLRTLAWDRHCKGIATQDIADEFDVPARTVRSWIAAIRDDLAADLAELRQTHLLLAVDGLRRLLATAWELLEVERDATLPLLESLAATAGSGRDAARARPSQAPRYINSVLAIQKELDRLLALNVTALTPTAQPQNAAETATLAPAQSQNPAETATPATDAQAETAAETAPASAPLLPAERGGGFPLRGLVPGERGLAGGEDPDPSPTESTESAANPAIPSPHGPSPRAKGAAPRKRGVGKRSSRSPRLALRL